MNKKVKNIAVASAMAGVLALGGIGAYFTDSDSASNEFTVGKISLDLTEPNWNPDNGKDITPNKEISKDPTVTNDGVNSEFVFLTVSVPYENIITANDDGTINTATDTELYSYTVNNGWTEIGTAKKDEAKKTITHTYVYGDANACTELAKGVATPTLFDSVKFVNAVEGQGLETSTYNIDINAYGIQTTDINGGKTAPSDVWSVLSTQVDAMAAINNQ